MKLLLAALLLAASPAYAGDTRYVWTNPAFQAKPDSCGDADTIPETGLSHVRMRLIRIDKPDTLDLGQKPLSGPGVMDSVLVSTTDGVWLHVFEVRAVDRAGNEACIPMTFLNALPVAEWPPAAPPIGPPGLSARYFENADFTGPTADTLNAPIDFSTPTWDTHNLGPGWFSVRWTGFVTAPAGGSWAFCVDSDDGARLWVDGRPIVDRWADGRLQACGTIGLGAGTYPIRLDFYQNGGAALARLFWTPPGGSESLVPAGALSH